MDFTRRLKHLSIFQQFKPRISHSFLSPPLTAKNPLYGVFLTGRSMHPNVLIGSLVPSNLLNSAPECHAPEATTNLINLLACAEDKMQHRSIEKGFSGLQIIVVEGKKTSSGDTATTSGGPFYNRKRSFADFVSGLKEDWYTVPRTDHRAEALRGIMTCNVGPRPGLFIFDSTGRVLLSSGARHLALDSCAIGFPWFENSESPLVVRHLLEPLTIENAVKSSRLVSLLILRHSDVSKHVSSLCAVLDMYKTCVNSLGGQFKVPPGDAAFYYTTDRVVGITSLLKVARGCDGSLLLDEVREALTAAPDGGGVLVNFWKSRGGKDVTYAVAVIPNHSAEILSSPHFFVHPSLPWMPTP